MTKQKRGLWVFLFSLIPGAGEMYMGFRRQGISIMFLFWGIIAAASLTNFAWLVMFLPIVWFYSFFNVHNLKSLSEEEFYSLEDTYILHMDQFIGDADVLLNKHRTIVAALLIFFGISILWNNFTDFLYWFLPSPLDNLLYTISYRLPQLIIAIAIIAAGCYMLSHKKATLDKEREEQKTEEHYWEPYRPYQQKKPSDTAHTDMPDSSVVIPPQVSSPQQQENQEYQEPQTPPADHTL